MWSKRSSAQKKWERKERIYGVKRDYVTGHLYYELFGHKIYVRTPNDCLREAEAQRLNDEIYYRYYKPSGTDVVVDIGAATGQEAILLSTTSPDLTYIAVEIQPWYYECLALNFALLPEGYKPFSLMIGPPSAYSVNPRYDALTVESLALGEVPVESIQWDAFLAKFQIQQIDLLKMNIEGGETPLLRHITDYENIKRLVISTHDFRANRGDGEHFRTKAEVSELLLSKGFSIRNFEGDEDYIQDWIFCERPNAK